MVLLRYFLGLSVLAGLFFACEVDTEFVTGNAVELRYEVDTLTFDTVFTARGSITRLFKVYNDADDPVMIDRIRVAGESGVTFTFNVDGFMGPEAEDVVIWGNDSIFVFVEAEVDPTQPEEVSPFVAEDRLLFEMGDVQDEVVLIAFGQNAFYTGLGVGNRGLFLPLSCDGGTARIPSDFDDPRAQTGLPILVYGSWIIDNCTIQIEAGTKIYFHGGIQRNGGQIEGLDIFNDGIILTTETGALQLLGTREEPILLRTDRLEPDFENTPAKYRGLIFGAGSRNNIIRHSEINNTIVGVTLDSLSEVTIENSMIVNSGGPAISGFQSDITVRNSLFHSNFGNTVQLIRGGNLTIEHSTLANYGVDASALLVANFDPNQEGEVCVISRLNTTIRNSIISGSRSSELALGDCALGTEPEFFRIDIQNSVVRTDDRFLQADSGLFADFYSESCLNCHNLQFSDPLFVDIDEDDYRLDSLSVARDLSPFLPALPVDLEGNTRGPAQTDAGALEFVPGG